MEGTLKFLKREDIQLLQPKLRLARARAEQQLVREGAPPLGLFIIRSGEVDVRRRMGQIDLTVATLRAGDMFGESAFLQEHPASASVFSTAEADLAIFTPDRVLPLFEANPGLFGRFFQSIAHALSRRLRAFNGQLSGGGTVEDQFAGLPNWEII